MSKKSSLVFRLEMVGVSPTARAQFSTYLRYPFYIAFPIIGFQIFMQYGMYIGFRTLPSPRLEQHWIFIVFPMFGHSLPLQGWRDIAFSLFSRCLAIIAFARLGQCCIFIVSQHSSLQYSQRGVNKFFGDVFYLMTSCHNKDRLKGTERFRFQPPCVIL